MTTIALADVPTADILAVFIGEPSAGQRHVGLAYRARANAELRYLHLGWHKDLRDEATVGTKYRAVRVLAYPAIAHSAVVAQCKRAAKADTSPQHISYGLGFPRATIRVDSTTNTMVIANASGLTCATFVLALFSLASLPLVNLGTWQDREGDAEWKANVIEHLKAVPGATEERIAQLESERDVVRIRPEDVAGAAASEGAPVSFTVATTVGQEILVRLRGER